MTQCRCVLRLLTPVNRALQINRWRSGKGDGGSKYYWRKPASPLVLSLSAWTAPSICTVNRHAGSHFPVPANQGESSRSFMPLSGQRVMPEYAGRYLCWWPALISGFLRLSSGITFIFTAHQPAHSPTTQTIYTNLIRVNLFSLQCVRKFREVRPAVKA